MILQIVKENVLKNLVLTHTSEMQIHWICIKNILKLTVFNNCTYLGYTLIIQYMYALYDY